MLLTNRVEFYQLQIRLGTSNPNSPSSSNIPNGAHTNMHEIPARQDDKKPESSTSLSHNPRQTSSTEPNNPIFQQYQYPNSDHFQADHRTKPPPGLSSTKPTQRGDSSSESSTSSISEPEIWEYRGTQLTRSALSLVLRQERLAMADSSGQYVGEMSWDDLRNAWIPNWAEKLKPSEVAEGELPNTNPAEYTVRRRDAWGNKIGWWEGRM